MRFAVKNRHLDGTAGAASALCCAAPLLTLLGIAGAAPAAATFVFAGAVFATVVAVGAVFAGSRRSVSTRDVRHEGRVDIELTDHRGRRSGVHP